MIEQGKTTSVLPENLPQMEVQDDQNCNPYKEEATRYRELGLAPIPLKDRSKVPALQELKSYLSRHATPEEIDSWEWAGVGIVTGSVSVMVTATGVRMNGVTGYPLTPTGTTRHTTK